MFKLLSKSPFIYRNKDEVDRIFVVCHDNDNDDNERDKGEAENFPHRNCRS